MSNKYDVIVIGAGIGGLTAAAILAKNGKRVLVLEKNPVPGGYVVAFKRKSFKFDATLHVINGCEEGGLTYRVLKEAGINDKIKFLKPKYIFRLIYPDFDLRIPQRNIDEYKSILVNYFPEEERGIKDLFKTMTNIFSDIQRLYTSNIPLKLELPYFPLKYPILFRYMNKSFEYMLNTFLKNHKLKSIISQSWLYFGLPPSRLSAIYFSYAWYDFFHNGIYYPDGGSEEIVDVLVNAIKEYGGDVIFNCEVTKIQTKNYIAKSVTVKNSEFFGEVVVSNIDPYHTFLNLVGRKNLPANFVKLLQNMEVSISAISIYCGLDKDIQTSENIHDYELFLSNTYNLDKQFLSCVNNDPNEVTFSLCLYHNLYPESITNKNTIMSISTSSSYDYWRRLPKTEYVKEKNLYAESILRRIKEHFPSLYRNISFINVSTPLTLERYTGNQKGATYGFSQIVSQSGIKRLPQVTPVKNLYLSSAWTQPGGGICGVMLSGMQVSGIILKKNFYVER
jgi:prolycopene isomerase